MKAGSGKGPDRRTGTCGLCGTRILSYKRWCHPCSLGHFVTGRWPNAQEELTTHYSHGRSREHEANVARLLKLPPLWVG